ncbi:hypothetical protein [Pedobacter immunditicola]|uniref:hypothetical protein n=1 Tax=Pedobacter immunditicola TaxID=3133440 RepID=UPI00309EC130
MARIDKNGGLRGSVGNVSYRVSNGQNILQTRPGKGNTKVHEVSLQNYGEFSLASNRARIIREILSPVIRSYYDGAMINRLNRTVVETIRSNDALPIGFRDIYDGQLSLLQGFEFNEHSLFSDYCKVEIQNEVTPAGLKLTMPAFVPLEKMAFPFNASHCTMKVLVSALDLTLQRFSYCCTKELGIPATNKLMPAVEWDLNENIPVRGLMLVTVSLNYSEKCLGEMVSLNRPKLNPCQLLRVFNAVGNGGGAVGDHGNEFFGEWFKVVGLVKGVG